jgi:hypothetical protein
MKTDNPGDRPTAILVPPHDHKPAGARDLIFFLLIMEHVHPHLHSAISGNRRNFDATLYQFSRDFTTHVIPDPLHYIFFRSAEAALVVKKLDAIRIHLGLRREITGVVCGEIRAIQPGNGIIQAARLRAHAVKYDANNKQQNFPIIFHLIDRAVVIQGNRL